MGHNVLVTGGSGFIGCQLAPLLLEAGHRVTVLDNFRYGNRLTLLPWLGHANLAIEEGDVRNTSLLTSLAKKVDAVIHLAAMVGAPVCTAVGEEETFSVNAASVASLVKSLSPSQRLIYPNSNSGYGAREDGSFCTEDEQMNPVTTYGLSKCRGEDAALQHPNAVSLRLATLYGVSNRPRLDLMVNDFVCRLLFQGKLELFQKDFFRNFVHVRDVARVMVTMMGEWGSRAVGAFNLADPELNIRKGDLARRVATMLGKDPGEVLSDMPGHDPDARNCRMSTAKLEKAIGFGTTVTLGAGVAEVRRLVLLATPEERARMRNKVAW